MSTGTTPPRAAVTSLYPDVAPELERYARRLGLAPNEADDVVSESFATLLSLEDGRLARIENLRAYLFTVVRNLASRTAQRRGRLVPVPDEDLDRPVFSEDDLVLAEDHELARAAFAALTALQQRVLWLTLVDRLPVREVADQLGISCSTVTTRAQRARAALRESYVAAFLRARPPSCGTDPGLLARVVLGTAPHRAQVRLDEHLLVCPGCRLLLEQGQAQASSRAVLGVVALGGVAAGELLRSTGGGTGAAGGTGYEDTAGNEDTAGSATSRRAAAAGRSGRRRLVLAVGLLLVLVLVAAASTSGAVGMLTATLRPPAPEPLAVVGIEATPERIALDMPAPGTTTGWSVTLTSSSDVTVSVLLSTVGSLSGRSLEQPLSTLRRDGLTLTGPTPLGEVAALVYLGEIRPGERITVDGTLARSLTDTDQTLGGTTDLRFSAGVGLGAGLAPGDSLDLTARTVGVLATTGTSVAAEGVVVVVLVVLGAVLVRRSRRR